MSQCLKTTTTQIFVDMSLILGDQLSVHDRGFDRLLGDNKYDANKEFNC